MTTTVYFIRAGEFGPVKVGHGECVRKRLSSIQSANHERLILMGTRPGGLAAEAAIHECLIYHRVRGEWFDGRAALDLLEELPETEPQLMAFCAERAKAVRADWWRRLNERRARAEALLREEAAADQIIATVMPLSSAGEAE